MTDLQISCLAANLTELCVSSCEILPDTPEGRKEDENVLLAFLLVAGAGMSTSFGSALVFFDFFSLKNNVVLGAALGFSSGVMIYVSFVEIFQKSVIDFTECDCLWKQGEDAAKIMAAVCFFGGVFITFCLDKLVHFLFAMDGSHGLLEPEKQVEEDVEDSTSVKEKKQVTNEDDPRKLHRMGIMTALAIGLHNFPEGLATFVATLADPSVGISLAVAIAIHNIPEGLCVAVPIFYATGSRWKGFFLSVFSGFTELIGAALGYAFLRTVLGPATYAVLFGVVAGMMTTIVLKELIPTAHRYDPTDRYVTNSLFLGAFCMALSLILFMV